MRAGHDVTIVCQERHPEKYDLGGARVVVPQLPDGLLPVFVLDDYEGLEARLLQDFTHAQREAYVQANAEALRALEPADVVFTAQNYHDVHNVPNIDIAAFNKSVFNALKPGGAYVVLDHAAAAGSGGRDTSTLHRIDPEAVKAEALAAGFVLAGQSKVLENPQDAHTVAVFDPSIRGKTDQFILKFTKPRK